MKGRSQRRWWGRGSGNGGRRKEVVTAMWVRK